MDYGHNLGDESFLTHDEGFDLYEPEPILDGGPPEVDLEVEAPKGGPSEVDSDVDAPRVLPKLGYTDELSELLFQ